jgi:hypothetical protein
MQVQHGGPRNEGDMSVEVFKDMLDQVMVDVINNGDELIFKTADGKNHKFYHGQDCCESVSIEDVCGDLADLVGSPLLVAEQVDNEDEPECDAESYTWTFYKFGTAKGSVTVRWLGVSNGFYSESVSYVQE